MALRDITDEVRALRDITHEDEDEAPLDHHAVDFTPYSYYDSDDDDDDDDDYGRENRPTLNGALLSYDHYQEEEEEVILTDNNIAAAEPSFVHQDLLFRSLRVLYPTSTQEELESFMQDLAIDLISSTAEAEQEEGFSGATSYERDCSSGLSEEIIRRNLKSSRIISQEEEDAEEICVVCQCEYELDEVVGRLGCGHEYHADCIKTWLLVNNSCPVCKRQAVPAARSDREEEEFD